MAPSHRPILFILLPDLWNSMALRKPERLACVASNQSEAFFFFCFFFFCLFVFCCCFSEAPFCGKMKSFFKLSSIRLRTCLLSMAFLVDNDHDEKKKWKRLEIDNSFKRPFNRGSYIRVKRIVRTQTWPYATFFASSSLVTGPSQSRPQSVDCLSQLLLGLISCLFPWLCHRV